MQLNSPDQIDRIINLSHFVIFAFPKEISFPAIRGAINISPNDKNVIPVENIHSIEELVRTKQSSSLTITVDYADQMTEQAQNCFLKLLEEPGDNLHFVFFTHRPSKLLATVRSRAHNFSLMTNHKIDSPPVADAKTIELAKQYISATPRELVPLSQTLAKNREGTLEMLDVAIELLYKSYFKTGNIKFLDKLEQLTRTRDNVSKNGHVRLHLVAGMIQ